DGVVQLLRDLDPLGGRDVVLRARGRLLQLPREVFAERRREVDLRIGEAAVRPREDERAEVVAVRPDRRDDERGRAARGPGRAARIVRGEARGRELLLADGEFHRRAELDQRDPRRTWLG